MTSLSRRKAFIADQIDASKPVRDASKRKILGRSRGASSVTTHRWIQGSRQVARVNGRSESVRAGKLNTTGVPSTYWVFAS